MNDHVKTIFCSFLRSFQAFYAYEYTCPLATTLLCCTMMSFNTFITNLLQNTWFEVVVHFENLLQISIALMRYRQREHEENLIIILTRSGLSALKNAETIELNISMRFSHGN